MCSTATATTILPDGCTHQPVACVRAQAAAPATAKNKITVNQRRPNNNDEAISSSYESTAMSRYSPYRSMVTTDTTKNVATLIIFVLCGFRLTRVSHVLSTLSLARW